MALAPELSIVIPAYKEESRLAPTVREAVKGYAVRTGVVNSLGRLVLFADADWATPFVELAGDALEAESKAL